MLNNRIEQWRNLRFGMFIHFGLYSILGGIWHGKLITEGYSEQILKYAPISPDEYESLTKVFNPVNFDANAIASLAVEAGMKYIVITAKHHDGFCLFHSRQTEYNAVEATPYGKDIVGELSEACQKAGLKLGVYFSWIDWHYPHSTPTSNNSDPIPEKHMDFNLAQVEELLTNYGPIAEFWFDMGAPTQEQSKTMVDFVHQLQPGAMVNGRVWHGLGDFTVLGDNEVPDFNIAGLWQTPASIYHTTWGYRSWQERTELDGKIEEQLSNLRNVLRRGGNYLLNIGPKGDGAIVDFEEDVLRGIGNSLQKEKIIFDFDYSIQPQKHSIGDGDLFYHFEGEDYYSNKPILVKTADESIAKNKR